MLVLNLLNTLQTVFLVKFVSVNVIATVILKQRSIPRQGSGTYPLLTQLTTDTMQ